MSAQDDVPLLPLVEQGRLAEVGDDLAGLLKVILEVALKSGVADLSSQARVGGEDRRTERRGENEAQDTDGEVDGRMRTTRRPVTILMTGDWPRRVGCLRAGSARQARGGPKGAPIIG